MDSDFRNVYDDETRAAAYAGLEYPATYALAFRDVPALLARHVEGRRALDFGCGTGRSTRFLRALGLDVVGVDIAERMIERARLRDPEGDYRLLPDGDLNVLEDGGFDLVFCAFPFDNTPMRRKPVLFRQMRRRLRERGRIVNLVSAPDIYVHEWASFSTREFPDNRTARTGDTVRIVMLDVPDRRAVEDVFCTDADYRALYAGAGLRLLETHRPLGRADEPWPWVTETEVSPWAIYVLAEAESQE